MKRLPLSRRFRRLRRIGMSLCVPALALALLTPAPAAPTPATIIIGGKTVPFIAQPYVGPQGQVYAPVDAVRMLGADYVPNPADSTVTVTDELGHKITVPYEMSQGRYCIALQKVVQALGADADWQPTTQTLTLRARLQMVRQDDNSLNIYTSYPVYYSVQHLDNPKRLYVDLYGLDLAAAPAAIPSSGNVTRIRSGQMNYQTVRIVIDLKKDSPFKVASAVKTSRIRVALGPATATVASAPGLPPGRTTPPRNVVIPPPPALSPAAPTIRITDVQYKTISDTLSQVIVSTNAHAKYRTETLNNPNRLAFDLAGAVQGDGPAQLEPDNDPVIKTIRRGKFLTPETRFGRVVVDLSHPVSFAVASQDTDSGTTYTISLVTMPEAVPPPTSIATANPHPPTAGLAGKIVVVDPGHGGPDTGAVGIGGAHEKDITLAIGKKLRDALQQNGATVFMTREDDWLPSVMARPKFANDHHADYFISIHCDESGPRNSHSGTTVYYHAQNALCRHMAADLSQRIAEACDIPRAGIKSDTIRFQTGFGVLRGSAMPAVLVECGYMNNERDLAKLKTDSTQQHIAEGIVAGLRDFVTDRSNQVAQTVIEGSAHL